VSNGTSVYVVNDPDGDQAHKVRTGLKLALCARAEIQKQDGHRNGGKEKIYFVIFCLCVKWYKCLCSK
jgi:hypothetical protein